MNSDTIFTVSNEDLNRLDQNTAVEFFQNLLWAEARRLGVEISKINISTRVNVPDGGVDATVDDVHIETGIGIIKQGKTSYQIKSGATFEPWQRSTIKKELFDTKGNLGKSIRTCLDADGTYILVCTAIELEEHKHEDSIKHIEDFLKQCGYSQPKVEVWSQNTLIGFLEAFPSLALSVNKHNDLNFQTHQSWSNNADMQFPFIAAEAQDELIDKIRSELREKINAIHVRVLGEPGIGKTKLVFEATRADDLAPLVIYCTPAEFRASGLRREILRDDNHFSAILIVDECDPSSRYDIWNELQNREPRIKLISIYNDYDPVVDSGISEFEILRLTDDQISTIIQGHGASEEQVDPYIEFCDGSPRMAHHTGNILADYPGDPSQLLKEDRLYQSFYVDYRREDSNSPEVQERELVLQYIALFKRFGFGGPVVADAQAIAGKVQGANPSITWSRFQKIIDDLKKRKILQGQSTLYITPKALHIKLWVEWWRIYGDSFDLEIFSQDLPPQSKLIEWFHEMFQYAAESEPASRIVKDLLGPDGPFRDGEYLKTRLGSRFFLGLADADPKAALKCLMRTIGTWDKDALLQFTDGRRDVVWALEKIAMKRDMFVDAARLLLALGEAENQGWSNNASGVFAKLFSPGRGRVAPTEASPAERLPVLKAAFESGSKEQRLLAVKACNEGLEFDHFSRMSGAEYRGLRNNIDFWEPKTYGELFDAYRQVWQLLSEQLGRLPKDEREAATDVLLQHASRLARRPNLSDMVLYTIGVLSEKVYVDNRLLIKTVVEFLHHNGKDLPDDMRQRWEQLRDELVGSDFHALMQRYVGMYLRVDAFDENENYFEEGHPQIQTLAQQAVENPSLLKSELHWLVTTDAKNGYAFGYQLAKRDEGFSLLPMLLEARRNAVDNASEYFLGGYFRVIFEADVAQWESQLDALVEDTILNVRIPQITQYSGMTDRAGLRILKLAKRGIIDINHFGVFGSGKVIECLTDAVFAEWIEFLLIDINNSTIPIVLRLYANYYVRLKPKPTLPCNLTFQLLTHPALFQASNTDILYREADYDWTEIGKAFLDLYPEKGLELAKPMLAHFGKTGTIVGAHFQTRAVLTEITKRFPGQMWERVSEYLERRDDFLRTHYLERWLTGENTSDSASTDTEKGTLPLMPREKIWEWIDGNVEDRARYLAATFGPATLSVEVWQTALARDLLVRYGDREAVRANLRANYAIEVSWGPESLHLDRKKQELLRIRAAEVNAENNINVKQWIDRYVEELDEGIERAKIREERHF